MNGVFVLQQKSLNTEEMILADDRRDKATSGISVFLESMLNHFSVEKVNAARLLKNDLDKYGGNIARQSFRAQTATLTNWVEDWTTKLNLDSDERGFCAATKKPEYRRNDTSRRSPR